MLLEPESGGVTTQRTPGDGDSGAVAALGCGTRDALGPEMLRAVLCPSAHTPRLQVGKGAWGCSKTALRRAAKLVKSTEHESYEGAGVV